MKYDPNDVIQYLASDNTNLRVELAHANAVIQAQSKKIKELEGEGKDEK